MCVVNAPVSVRLGVCKYGLRNAREWERVAVCVGEYASLFIFVRRIIRTFEFICVCVFVRTRVHETIFNK